MSDKKRSLKSLVKEVHKGYQPSQNKTDPSNPPRGGSGVPTKVNSDKKE